MNIPAKLRAPLSDADHVLGPVDAPVVLLEYGDYACPFCAAAHELVAQLLNEMQRSLRFAFRNFPLSRVHPDSVDAARAAEAAALQQRYWQMHDTLFENQDRLDRRHLVNYAAALGLNLKRFPADFSGPAVEQRIESDIYGGVRSGVNGTPTFFINGWRFDGNLSYQGLRETFEHAQSIGLVSAR
jgi:protein-disulfide isomerase